jgi:uncharacterized membrane protein
MGGVFGKVLGGVLGGFDAEEIVKQVATAATAAAVKGPISSAFQKMKVAGRVTLAEKLEKCAGHLRKGECDAAAGVAADVIDDIRL